MTGFVILRFRDDDDGRPRDCGLQALRVICRQLPEEGAIQVDVVDGLQGAMLCRVDLVRDQRQRF